MQKTIHDPLNLDLTDLRAQLGRTIDRVHFGSYRVLVRRRGRAVAALVSVQDFLALEEASAKDLSYARFQMAERMVKWEALKDAVMQEGR